MKTIIRSLTTAALALAAMFVTGSAWALNHEQWSTIATNADTGTYNPDGIVYANNQCGIAVAVEFAADSLANYEIVKIPGDHIVKLATDGDGKYTIKVCSGSNENNNILFNVTSDVSATAGRHLFAILVRRGLSGGDSQIVSVLVNLDGNRLFTIGDGSKKFTSGPLRRIICGQANSKNVISGSCWTKNSLENAGNNDSDPTKLAEIQADAEELYPAAQEIAISGNSVSISEINELVEEDAEIANVTLDANATINFDVPAVINYNFVCSGALTFNGFPSQQEAAKFDFSRIAGGYKQAGARLIGINFRNNTNADRTLGDNDDAEVPGFTFPGKGWTQSNSGSGSNVALKVYDPATDSVSECDAKANWTANGTYDCQMSCSKIIRGYLDDNASTQVKMTSITGIPFDAYDVIIFASTDTNSRPFSPKMVNGVLYSSDAKGNAKLASGWADNWGMSKSATVVMGGNAMRVNNLVGDLSIISGKNANNARGCVAAIMIIERKIRVGDEYVFANGDCTATNDGGVGGYTPKGLTVSPVGGITADVGLAVKDVTLVLEGTSSDKAGYITLKNAEGTSVNSSAPSVGGQWFKQDMTGLGAQIKWTFDTPQEIVVGTEAEMGASASSRIRLYKTTDNIRGCYLRLSGSMDQWRPVFAVTTVVTSVPTKATVTIDTSAGEVYLPEITWDDLVPSADIPAEINITGSGTLRVCPLTLAAKSLTFKSNSGASVMIVTTQLDTYSCGSIVSKIPITVEAYSQIDVDAGANALTYDYYGANEITPTLSTTGTLKIGAGAVTLTDVAANSHLDIANGATLKLNLSAAKTINGIEGTGKLIKEGSARLTVNNKASGFVVDGTTVQIDAGDIYFNGGVSGADNRVDPTFRNVTFILNTNGLPTPGGWFDMHGTITFVSDGNYTVFGSGKNVRAYDNLAFVKRGTGTVTFSTGFSTGDHGPLDGIQSVRVEAGQLAFTNTAVLSPTALALDFSAFDPTATPINGDFKLATHTAFTFPSTLAENTPFTICTGTLSDAVSDMYQITVGEKTDFATLTFENNTVSYAWVSASTATVSENAKWSELNWNIKPDATKAVEITFSADSAILTLDESACAGAKIIGNNSANQIIALQGTVEAITAFIGKISATDSFAGKFVYRYDATSGLTVDSTLLNTIKNDSGDITFVFIGDGDNGATLNFGDPGKTLSSHIVFEGGKHAMTIINGNRLFANGATGENPTVLVKDETTLDFTAKDLSGWSTSVDITGVIRVNDGGTLNFLQNEENTFFYHQRLWLDPGALMTFNFGETSYTGGPESNFRWNGGTAEATAQIYVPASDTDQTANPAIIRQVVDGLGGAFHLASDGTKGIAFFVGANSKLIMDTPFTGKDGRAATKYGAGVFELVNGTDNVNLTIATASTLVLGDDVSSLALGSDTTVEVANETTITALSGAHALTKTGAGALKVANAISGVTSITAQAGTVDLSTQALPLTTTLVSGAFKINLANAATAPRKIAPVPANTEVSAFTIIGSDDETIEKLCIYDGFLWYGQHTTEEYTITDDDKTAIEALPAGGVYSPATLEVNITTVTGAPEGYLAWAESGKAYVAQKSNSISLKTGARTIKDDNNHPWATSILSTDERVGGFPVAGKFWNNTKISNGNQAEVKDYMLLTDGNGVQTQVSVAYRAHNTYYAKNSAAMENGNMRLTGSYLDDNQENKDTQYTISESSQPGVTIPGGSVTLPKAPNARGWQFEVSNIPYEMYDLYVYIASDVVDNIDNINNHLYACPVVISCDGENWTYYAGPAKATDSDSWEAYGWAHEGNVVEGKNYIRFRISKNSMGLDDISTIHITHGTRNTGANKRLGLAGIQIVEIDDDGVRDRVASSEEIQSWHDEKSWLKKKGEGTELVDWTDSDETTPITARINADTIPEIVMDSAAVADRLVISNTAPGTGEQEKTFTISGTAALTTTTIDATGFTGNIVFDAPVSGALSLGENAKVVVEIDEGEEMSVDNILPAGLTIASGSVTITGSGTLVCNGKVPEAYKTSLQSSAWQGTVWIKNILIPDVKDIKNFGDYKNNNSKICVTGLRGWVDSGSQNVTLELKDETVDDVKVLGIEIQDSSGGYKYVFPKFTGTGSFKAATRATTTAAYIVTDVSEFEGALLSTAGTYKMGSVETATTPRPIFVGYTQNEVTASTESLISIKSGVTMRVNGGWQADSVAFGDTLNLVSGAAGDTIISGLTAKPASLPAITIGGQPTTFVLKYENGTVKVVAAAEIEITGEASISAINTQAGSTPAIVTIKGENAAVKFDATPNASIKFIAGEGATVLKFVPGADSRFVSLAEVKQFEYEGFTSFKYDWAAGEVISLNFGSNETNASMSGDGKTDTFAGVQIPDASWVNLTGGSGTDVAVGKYYDSVGDETIDISGMTVTYADGNGGTYHPSGSNYPFMRGYLDDNKDSSPTVTIKNVPFATYDIVVYMQGDDGSRTFTPIQINDNLKYTYDSTGAIVSSADFTATDVWGLENQTDISYEHNVIRITGLSGDTKIKPLVCLDTGSRRGTLAAIQIVNTGNQLRTTWTGAANDGAWDTAGNWDNGVPTANSIAVIPAETTTEEITVTANSTAKLLVAKNFMTGLVLNGVGASFGGIDGSSPVAINNTDATNPITISGTISGTAMFGSMTFSVETGAVEFDNVNCTINIHLEGGATLAGNGTISSLMLEKDAILKPNADGFVVTDSWTQDSGVEDKPIFVDGSLIEVDDIDGVLTLISLGESAGIINNFTTQNFASGITVSKTADNKSIIATTIITWAGASGADWNVAENWSPAIVPADGYMVAIDATSEAKSINLPANTAVVASLTLTGANNVSFTGTGAINATAIDASEFMGKIGVPATGLTLNGAITGTLTLDASAAQVGTFFTGTAASSENVRISNVPDGLSYKKTDAGYVMESATTNLRYGYAFNDNLDKETAATATLSIDGAPHTYTDGVRTRALQFTDGKNYGTNFGYGNSRDWTIVGVVKAPTAANKCIFSLGGQKGTDGLIGLRTATTSTIAVFTKDGTDLITSGEITAQSQLYHIYAIKYNGETGKIALSIDGGAYGTEVSFTPGSGGQFQFGGIHGGAISGKAENATSGGIDEFRFYEGRLSVEQINTEFDDFIVHDFVWIGESGGEWSEPANWSRNAVPGEGDNVIIDVGSATDYSIVIDSDTAALNSLTVSGSGIVFSGEGTITGPVTIDTHNLAGKLKVQGNTTITSSAGGSIDFSAALDVTGNLTFSNAFTQNLTFTTGTEINVSGNMSVVERSNAFTYFNAGVITVGGTLSTTGPNGGYGRYFFGDGTSANDTMVITANKLSAGSTGTIYHVYDFKQGVTLNIGAGGFDVWGHTSYDYCADVRFAGGKYVATATSNFSTSTKYLVTADSTIEVVEGATLTVKNSGKDFGQDGKKITKAGLGLLKFEGPVLTDIDVTAGTVEMTAGDEEGVVVSDGAGLRLKVTAEQEAGGYTSTATIPTGTNIIFILPDGTELAGQGNVLPAQAVTWVGADQGSWDDSANWSPAYVPAETTSVNFTGEGDPITIKIPHEVPRTVKNVTFSATRDITIDGVLTVNGTITKSGAGKLGINLGADYAKNLAISAGALEIIVPEGTTRTLGGLISGSGTFVKSGAGTLKMSSNQFAIPSTLTIDIAEGVFEAGGKDRGFDGKVIVRKGATYNAMIKDFAHYDQSCEIDVYGTLHFGPNVRWTLTQNNLFKIYPGALITGDSTMDGGAHINLHKTGAKVSFITEAGITETTAEISAVIGPGGNDDAGVVEVAEGLTLTLSGNGSSDVNRRKPIIKKGAGTIIVTGDMSGLDGFQVLEGAAAFTGENTTVKTFKLDADAIISATTKTIVVQNTLTLPATGTFKVDLGDKGSGNFRIITGPNGYVWDTSKVSLIGNDTTDWNVSGEGATLVVSKLPLDAKIYEADGYNFGEKVIEVDVTAIDSALTGTKIKVVTTDKAGKQVSTLCPIDGSKGKYRVTIGNLIAGEAYNFNVTFVDGTGAQIVDSKEADLENIAVGTLIKGEKVFSADATSGISEVEGGNWEGEMTIENNAYVISDDNASVFSVTNAPTGNYTVEYDLTFEEGFVSELTAETDTPIAGLTIGEGATEGTFNWYRVDSENTEGNGWAKLDQSVTAGHYLIRMAFTATTVTYSVKGDTDTTFTTLTQDSVSAFTRGGESAAAIQSVSFSGASALAKFNAKNDDEIDTMIANDGEKDLETAGDVVAALAGGKRVTLKTNVAIDTSSLEAGKSYNITAGDFDLSFIGTDTRIVKFVDGVLTISALEVEIKNGQSNKVNSDLNLDPTESTDKPFVKAVHTDNPNAVAFELFHGAGVNEKKVADDDSANAKAKFYVESSTDANFTAGTVEKSPSAGVKDVLEVPLPMGDTKVRYYRLKFD